ncbi:MAG: phage tail protein [Synergistaceae bacterium]|jgi:hypothetical protein|nr:phage tail protein [Synergistaceae bacterium]
MIGINVQSEIDHARIVLSGAPEKLIPAVVRSLTKAVAGLDRKTVAEAAKKYKVKPKDIRQAIRLRRANRTQLSASVEATTKRLALRMFKITPAEPRPEQVQATIQVGDTHDIPQAFVARLHPSSGVGVYRRKDKRRFPLYALKGPSVGRMITDDLELMKLLKEEGAWTFTRTLRVEIARALKGAAKK